MMSKIYILKNFTLRLSVLILIYFIKSIKILKIIKWKDSWLIILINNINLIRD